MNHELGPPPRNSDRNNEAIFNELTQDVFPVEPITEYVQQIQRLSNRHLASQEGKYFATQDDVDNELSRISEAIDAELAKNNILAVGNRLIIQPTSEVSVFKAIRKKGNTSKLSEIQLHQNDYIEGVFAGVLVDEPLIDTEIREFFADGDDATTATTATSATSATFVPHYITTLTPSLCLYASAIFPAEEEMILLDKQSVVFVPLLPCYPRLGRVIPPVAV